MPWRRTGFSSTRCGSEERSQQLIAQLKVAREDAEAALQEKNLFLSTASHDLRQPIHAMSMLVEAIAQRNRDAGLTPLLADLRNGMGSMNLMFTSLLDLSKLEAGIVTQRAAPVRLHRLVHDTVVMFREQASQRGLTLRLHARRHEEATVWADPALLRQALVNLVHNALRYTERGGILIGWRRRGAHWQIEVWDTGVGIAAEDGPQIFSPYFRNEHAWRLDSAGHGLGLAVVARCAKLMDAPLGFQSRLGKGSRFWLRLPARAHTEHEEQRGNGRVEAPAPLLRHLSGRCLVLDDDPQVLAAWKVLLEGWGRDGPVRHQCDGSPAAPRRRLHARSGLLATSACARAKVASTFSGRCCTAAHKPAEPWSAASSIRPSFRTPSGKVISCCAKPLNPAELHAHPLAVAGARRSAHVAVHIKPASFLAHEAAALVQGAGHGPCSRERATNSTSAWVSSMGVWRFTSSPSHFTPSSRSSVAGRRLACQVASRCTTSPRTKAV